MFNLWFRSQRNREREEALRRRILPEPAPAIAEEASPEETITKQLSCAFGAPRTGERDEPRRTPSYACPERTEGQEAG